MIIYQISSRPTTILNDALACDRCSRDPTCWQYHYSRWGHEPFRGISLTACVPLKSRYWWMVHKLNNMTCNEHEVILEIDISRIYLIQTCKLTSCRPIQKHFIETHMINWWIPNKSILSSTYKGAICEHDYIILPFKLISLCKYNDIHQDSKIWNISLPVLLYMFLSNNIQYLPW